MGGKTAFDPAKHFRISDIALWTSSLSREGEFQASLHEGETVVQTMRSTQAQEYSAEFEGVDEVQDVLRGLVSLGVRSVFREGHDDEVTLYTFEATFSVDYFILKRPSDEELQKFVEFNCVHNVWPFWRQLVYDTLKRASLPVPVIPFFSGGREKPDVKRRKAQVKSSP